MLKLNCSYLLNYCFLMTIAVAQISFLTSTHANASLLIPELEAAHAHYENNKTLCVAGLDPLVSPYAEEGHPEALIALGDMYMSCVEAEQIYKFTNLLQLYGAAAISDSKSEGVSNKLVHARRWGYHRLWYLLNSTLMPLDENKYVKDIHTLAAASLFHGGVDVCSFYFGEKWLDSRSRGCELIAGLANDQIYPTDGQGWNSPFKLNPLRGALMQAHLAIRTNNQQEEVDWAFEFFNEVIRQDATLAGSVMCQNSSNLNASIAALMARNIHSPLFSTCSNKQWNAKGSEVKRIWFTDYGFVVRIENNPSLGLVALPDLRNLVFDASKDLDVDISKISELDVYINNLYERIMNDLGE